MLKKTLKSLSSTCKKFNSKCRENGSYNKKFLNLHFLDIRNYDHQPKTLIISSVIFKNNNLYFNRKKKL